ncbi:hypothetical protein MNBD_NITROSPINAE02-864 [hydrothermal vent metagenome]|uniref:Lipopolysaccharide export system permease protein LptG n=1 Tax=hydrothermal vent metagenome TaxID=652676 RepID=A0A3B1CK58_9ZZZZ
MRIIDKYVLQQFFKLFFLSLAGMVMFYEMAVFLDMVGAFAKFHSTLDESIRFMLFKIPVAVFHVTPLCVLQAALLTTLSMSRYSEIVAIKAAGKSIFSVAAPLIAGGAIIAIFSFFNSEYVIHLTEKETNRIYYDEIKEQPRKSLFSKDKFWYTADDGSIWNVEHIDTANNRLSNMSIFRFDKEERRLTSRITASEGLLVGDKWILKDFVKRTFPSKGQFNEERLAEKAVPASSIPSEDLNKVKLYPEEMNLNQIREYIRSIRSKGYDATKYTVDMHAKIGFPLISLVMPLIAIPMGLRSGRAGGMFAGVGLALLIGALFWFTFSMGVAFGHAGRLPPALAAYGAHMIFGALGLLFLMSDK